VGHVFTFSVWILSATFATTHVSVSPLGTFSTAIGYGALDGSWRGLAPFRTARIRYVAQRAEWCCVFGKCVDVYQPPEAFQADDEGSIPFTRSNVFSALQHFSPPASCSKGRRARSA
jgi:hypothetical protein